MFAVVFVLNPQSHDTFLFSVFLLTLMVSCSFTDLKSLPWDLVSFCVDIPFDFIIHLLFFFCVCLCLLHSPVVE